MEPSEFMTGILLPQAEIRHDYKALAFVHRLTGIEKAILISRNFSWLSDEEILSILIACADWIVYTNEGMRSYYKDYITLNDEGVMRSQAFVLNAYGTVFECNVDVVTPGSIIYDICDRYSFVSTCRDDISVNKHSGIFKDTPLSYAMCHTFIPIEKDLVLRKDDKALEPLIEIITKSVNNGISCYLTELIAYAAVDVTIGNMANFDYNTSKKLINDPLYSEISDNLISMSIAPDKNNVRYFIIGANFFNNDLNYFITKFLGSLLIRFLDIAFTYNLIDDGDCNISYHIAPIVSLFDKYLSEIGYDISKLSLGLFKSESNDIRVDNFIKNKYTSATYKNLHMGVVYEADKEKIILHRKDIFYERK